MTSALVALCLSLAGVCEPEVMPAFESRDRVVLVELAPPVAFSAPKPERRAPVVAPVGVEHWRPLVERYFTGGDVERALCLMWHESRGDPNARNPSSGASGLFQHLPKYWGERSAAAGWGGADIFDPEANVAVAAWLRQHGWQHWSPYNRGLCR